MYNPLRGDENFKEIVRLILFDNQLGILLEQGLITIDQFNDILYNLGIPLNSWSPARGVLEEFNSNDFYKYLDEVHNNLELTNYFKKLFFSSQLFLESNRHTFLELDQKEIEMLFVDAYLYHISINLAQVQSRDGDDDPIYNECPCQGNYNVCILNAETTLAIGTGVNTTIWGSVGIYSGGALGPYAAGGWAVGELGLLGNFAADYINCNRDFERCMQLNRDDCYRGHGGSGPEPGQGSGVNWWWMIPNKN